MIGTIIGDIAGRPYEGSMFKSKHFPLFQGDCYFTDDTTMSIAVASAIMDCLDRGVFSAPGLRCRVVEKMQSFGRKYPYGFGRNFKQWVWSDEPCAYGSYGNGSAMRVSSVGWLFNSPDEVREMAFHTAAVTHNHPEGIKGAEAVASAVYLARIGHSKEQIRAYIEANFPSYNMRRTCDEIRPYYRMDVSCQGSVPEAIIAFLDATDFEDAIRNAVSLGGDTDTTAAIAGSIAEAYYGVPKELEVEAKSHLPADLLAVLEEFQNRIVSKRKILPPNI